MITFRRLHYDITEISNCILGNINTKQKVRRIILQYIRNILLELTEDEQKELAKDIENWLINN